MWLENIGRTIGDILGLNKKKEIPPAPLPVQRPTPTPTTPFQQPGQFNPVFPTVQSFQAKPTPVFKAPTTQPITTPTPLPTQRPFVGPTMPSITRPMTVMPNPVQDKTIEMFQKYGDPRPFPARKPGTLPTLDDFTKYNPEVSKLEMAAAQKRLADQAKSLEDFATGFKAVTQPVRSFSGGVVKSVATLPTTLTGFVGNVGDFLTPDQTPYGQFFKDLGTKSQQASADISKSIDSFYDAPGDSTIVKDIFGTGGQLATDIATGKLAAGFLLSGANASMNSAKWANRVQSLVPSIKQGMLVYNDNFTSAKAAGKSDAEAGTVALASSGIQGALEKFGMDRLFKSSAGKNVFYSVLTKAISEGGQEGAQQLVGNAFEKTYNPNRDIFDGVAYSALIGGIVGGTAGGAIKVTGAEVDPIEMTRKSAELLQNVNDELAAAGSSIRVTSEQIKEYLTGQMTPENSGKAGNPNTVTSTANSAAAGANYVPSERTTTNVYAAAAQAPDTTPKITAARDTFNAYVAGLQTKYQPQLSQGQRLVDVVNPAEAKQLQTLGNNLRQQLKTTEPKPQKVQLFPQITQEQKTVPGMGKKINYVSSNNIVMGSDVAGPYDINQIGYYRNQIRNGKKIAPVVVNIGPNGEVILVDGKHRLAAMRQLGVTNIPVVVRKGRPTVTTKTGVAANAAAQKQAQPVYKLKKGPGHDKLGQFLNEAVNNGTIFHEDAIIIAEVLNQVPDSTLNNIVWGTEVYGNQQTAGLTRTTIRKRYRNGRKISEDWTGAPVQITLAQHLANRILKGEFQNASFIPAVTFMHEYGHFGWYTLLSEQERNLVRREFRRLGPEWNRRVFFSQGLGGSVGGTTTDVKEFWAEAFAEYVFNNKVPSKSMKPLLQRFKDKLVSALERLKNRNEQLPRLQPLFDKILTQKLGEPTVSETVKPPVKMKGGPTPARPPTKKPKPVKKAPPKPELSPQEADDSVQKLIFGEAKPNYNVSKIGSTLEKYSLGKVIRKVTHPFENIMTKLVQKSLNSGSRINRIPGVVVTGFTKQLGRTPAEFDRAIQYQGQKKVGDIEAQALADMGTKALQDNGRLQAIHDFLNPELAKRKAKDAGVEYVEPKLTDAEKAIADKLRAIIDATHEGNYALGLISPDVYEQGKGVYFPRDFTEFYNDDVNKYFAKDFGLDNKIFKHRKDLADIPKEVIQAAESDPFYLTALRVQQFNRNKAVVEYMNYLAKNGNVSDVPKTGYVKIPESKKYAALSGKYLLKEDLENVQGFVYESTMANQAMALLNAYDKNPLRQGRKALLTVVNPGVRLGNRTFNYLTSSLNGVNAITFTRNYIRAKKMMKENSPEYLEAARQGIFGRNFIEKELYHVKPLRKSPNVAKKAAGALSETYQAVDEYAKLAMYLSFRERGVSASEAAHRTARYLQNYDEVGRFFDIGAKTPIGGSAFVRFSSELLRIGMNTALDNPQRAFVGLGAVGMLATLLSQLSGESEEDRKTRENRVGAPRIPFTNTSLEFQTPWGAVNIARLFGISTYNDLSGGSANDSFRFLPFVSPVKVGAFGAVEWNPNFLTGDPLIGPVLQQLLDMDFRGKKISDPENVGQFAEPLAVSEQIRNRLNAAYMAYTPLANELDNLLTGFDQKSETYYGKDLNALQAILKTFGVKVEQYGPAQAQKQRDVQGYFDEKAYLDSKIKNMNTKEAEAYKRLTGYYKSREKVPNEFSPGTERWKKYPVYNFPEEKWSDVNNNPKIYDLLVEKAQLDSLRQGSPIKPEYDKRLSPEFRKQLVSNKSLAPGEDVEADQRMYNNPEWDKYMAIKKEYTDASAKYYPETAKSAGTNEVFVDETVKHVTNPYPEKGPAKQAYDNAYALYAQGQGPKPAFTDAVGAEKDAYEEAKRVWTNKERAARGLPAIDAATWNNVSFGFQSNEEKIFKELKYGKGYGGYGGYGAKPKYLVPEKFRISTAQAAPKTRGKITGVRKVTLRKPVSGVSKPKVSIRKNIA